MSPGVGRADQFREFARTSARRAPLYARLAASFAEDPEVLEILDAAPLEQRRPVLLLAAVHDLLLRGVAPELAAHYPNLAAGRPAHGDPVALFRSVVLQHRVELRHTVAHRRTQTNELGRAALMLPALDSLAVEMGPLAHIDVGASAGLNLLAPLLGYRYLDGDGRPLVVLPGHDAAPQVQCQVLGDTPGDTPTAPRLPVGPVSVAHSVGLDQAPIDVDDDDAVRWLEACVWPDMVERFALLRAGLQLARRIRPTVRRGDAVDDLPAVVADASSHGHPVISTSWVLNYLALGRREEFVAMLDALGRRHDLSWIVVESPAETVGLPVPTTAPPEEITVVSIVRWRAGQRQVQRWATAHPHGFWMRWSTTPGSPVDTGE